MRSAWLRCGDVRQSIPRSSLLKAPRIRQRKGGPLLSLPLCSPASLYLSPLLCAQVCALTHQLQRQLRREKVAPEVRAEAAETHLRPWVLAVARRGGEEKKVCEGAFGLCVVESPFVYTCDRWMGLVLAAPSSFRSPKSPALSKSSNCAHESVGRTGCSGGDCCVMLPHAVCFATPVHLQSCSCFKSTFFNYHS